jgi:hypothetical protein
MIQLVSVNTKRMCNNCANLAAACAVSNPPRRRTNIRQNAPVNKIRQLIKCEEVTASVGATDSNWTGTHPGTPASHSPCK